jgi:chromosome partitioning protein
VIPIDTKLRDASRLGIPGPIFAPTSKASEAYGELLELLLQDLPQTIKPKGVPR